MKNNGSSAQIWSWASRAHGAQLRVCWWSLSVWDKTISKARFGGLSHFMPWGAMKTPRIWELLAEVCITWCLSRKEMAHSNRVAEESLTKGLLDYCEQGWGKSTRGQAAAGRDVTCKELTASAPERVREERVTRAPDSCRCSTGLEWEQLWTLGKGSSRVFCRIGCRPGGEPPIFLS